MLAEPHMLGFDPSMIPIRAADGSVQYDITVHTAQNDRQVFRTVRLLFDGGSRAIFSRGTRVWEALRLDGLGNTVGEPVVLKDCWVDGFREREGDISARIRQSAVSLDDDDRTTLGEMLLTVVAHGDVQVAGASDRALRVPCEEPSDVVEEYDRFTGAGQGAEREEGRVHYRIVYAEVGKPLCDETSLFAIYKALVETCAGTYITLL